MRRSIARSRRAATSALLAAGLLAAGAPRATPQPATAEPEPSFAAEVAVGYVLVPVVVRSPKGFVVGLEPDDFTLLVDGERVAFDAFETGTQAPISVLFAQDLSGSMGVGNKLQLSRAFVECFLARRRPGDQFAMASFAADLIAVDVPFTSEVAPVLEALDLWEGYGRTALHDAVGWLPNLVAGQEALKRAAVLITDGVDNASDLDPITARAQVRKAELPVYVLGLSTGSAYAVDETGVKLFRYADVLNLLASLSGGQYHSITALEDVQSACDAIAAELRHQYVLGFPLRGAGESAYHELRVEVDGPDNRRLSFRQGYEGRPPEGGAGGR